MCLSPHSTGDLSAPVSPQDLRRDLPDAIPGSHPHFVRELIEWPKMSDNNKGYQLDQDLTTSRDSRAEGQYSYNNNLQSGKRAFWIRREESQHQVCTSAKQKSEGNPSVEGRNQDSQQTAQKRPH